MVEETCVHCHHVLWQNRGSSQNYVLAHGLRAKEYCQHTHYSEIYINVISQKNFSIQINLTQPAPEAFRLYLIRDVGSPLFPQSPPRCARPAMVSPMLHHQENKPTSGRELFTAAVSATASKMLSSAVHFTPSLYKGVGFI